MSGILTKGVAVMGRIKAVVALLAPGEETRDTRRFNYRFNGRFN